MKPGVAALVLLAAVMHASWNVALRGGRDRLWSAAAMSFSAALACAFALPFLSPPARASWPYLLASTAIHIVYQLLLVRMYRQGEFGITYPVARGSSPLLISIGGAALSSEYLSGGHTAGVLLISAGILTLASGAHHLHRTSVLAALSTGLSIAAYSLTDGIGGRLAGSAAGYTAWIMLLCGLAMPFAAMGLRRGNGGLRFFESRGRRDFLQALGGGLISVTGYGLVIWAMQRTPMGLVSALRETSVLFAAVLGRVFLDEPFTWRKTISAALICGGILCLA
jgi:drug/metabolite transporter (DMT)-like permease